MSAEQTVNDIITDARDFASQSYDSATSLIQSAQNAAGGFVLLEPRKLYFRTDDTENIGSIPVPGLFSDSYTRPETRPDTPSLDTVPLPDLPEFPEAPEALDTSELFNFDRPVFDIASFDGTVPVLNIDYDIPDAPVLAEYADPETTALSLRETPEIDIPRFDNPIVVRDPGDVPDLAAEYQSVVQTAIPEFRDWVETYADSWLTKYAPEYHTAMAQLEARISRGFDGNTALPDAIEQQIFDRAVSRTLDEQVRMDQEATAAFAKRGYKVPPVALFGALNANGQVVARAASGAARETAIERARLEHEHIQFVMQLSSAIRDGLRGQVIQYSGLLLQVNGQAIEHARQVSALMTEAYRMLIELARLDLSQMQILAQIFETEMKSAMADIEIFKLEMEAAKTRKDAELADVAIWEKKIDAQNTKINLYLAQIRAVVDKASIEKIKIDLFGEELKAYTAKINAKESEYGAYTAAIRGDEAIVNAYSQEVSAYREGVNASRAKLDAEVAQTEAVTARNKSLTDIFQAELGAYETDVRAETSRLDGSVNASRMALDRYRAVLDGEINTLRIKYDKDRLDLSADTAQLNADVQTLLAQGQIFQRQLALRAETAMSGATAFGSMASSAVSAQNTMVNLVNETVNGG